MCTAPPIGAATAAGCAAFVRPRWRGYAINRRSLKAEGLTNLRGPVLAAEKGERPATPCNKSLRFSETGAPRSVAGRRACGRGRAGEDALARPCRDGRGVRGTSGGLVGRGLATRARRAPARPR